MSKPVRRRRNKHNLSFIGGVRSNGTVENIPRSRKAFKVFMRDDQSYQTHDFSIIKKAVYGLKSGEVVYLTAEGEGYELNNKKLAGYYSVNAKGQPVNLTDDQLAQYKEIKRVEKENRQKYKEA